MLEVAEVWGRWFDLLGKANCGGIMASFRNDHIPHRVISVDAVSRVVVPRCRVPSSDIVFSMISFLSWRRSLAHRWTTSCVIRQEEEVVGSTCMRF